MQFLSETDFDVKYFRKEKCTHSKGKTKQNVTWDKVQSTINDCSRDPSSRPP